MKEFCLICYNDDLDLYKLCKFCIYKYCNKCSSKLLYKCSICYRINHIKTIHCNFFYTRILVLFYNILFGGIIMFSIYYLL